MKSEIVEETYKIETLEQMLKSYQQTNQILIVPLSEADQSLINQYVSDKRR